MGVACAMDVEAVESHSEHYKVLGLKPGASLLDVEVNDTVTVKATVEEHKEYQGVNQTVIKRPKIITKGENK